MCGIDVVDAITTVAATPSVPLATMFHAAHSPASDRLSAEHVDARRAPDDRQQHGEQQERHLDDEPSGDAEQRHPADQRRRATISPA